MGRAHHDARQLVNGALHSSIPGRDGTRPGLQLLRLAERREACSYRGPGWLSVIKSVSIPRRHRRRSALIGTALGLIVALFGWWALYACEVPSEPNWIGYDEETYLQVAEQIVRADQIPHVGMRPPLYPGVIATFLAVDRESALDHVVWLQKVCWVANGVLVFATTCLIGGRPLIGVLAGLAYLTMAEPLDLVRLIYAETIASTLALLSLALFVVGSRKPFRSGWLIASALTAAGAAHSRPIFQMLLAVLLFLALLTSGSSWRERAARSAPFALVGVLLLGPFYAYNAVHRDGLYFVKMGHLGLVNYIGDRRVLGRFPEDLAYVEDIYGDFFERNPNADHAPWWEIVPQWRSAYEARGGRSIPPETFGVHAGRDALRVLVTNPAYWLTRWSETWMDFATSTGKSASSATACPTQACTGAWSSFWRYAGAWLPVTLLLGQMLCWLRKNPRSATALAPIVAYVAIATANTAIEPWGGQVRYRAPLQGFLLIALGVAASSAIDYVRRRPEVAAPDRRHPQ